MAQATSRRPHLPRPQPQCRRCGAPRSDPERDRGRPRARLRRRARLRPSWDREGAARSHDTDRHDRGLQHGSDRGRRPRARMGGGRVQGTVAPRLRGLQSDQRLHAAVLLAGQGRQGRATARGALRRHSHREYVAALLLRIDQPDRGTIGGAPRRIFARCVARERRDPGSAAPGDDRRRGPCRRRNDEWPAGRRDELALRRRHRGRCRERSAGHAVSEHRRQTIAVTIPAGGSSDRRPVGARRHRQQRRPGEDGARAGHHAVPAAARDGQPARLAGLRSRDRHRLSLCGRQARAVGPVDVSRPAVMTTQRRDAPRERPIGLSSRQLRLASGLVLLSYISMHLATHTFGLWSLDLAEGGLAWTKALWQSWPGTVALYGAAAGHFALALRTIYQRRHWGLPAIEIIRLWAGFSLPLLLISHVVTTRLTLELFGISSDYHRIVGSLVASGNEGWQIAPLAPRWLPR